MTERLYSPNKVMNAFVVKGKLKEIPAQRKKRDIILNWLAQSFEPNRRYTEKEVNAIIQGVHWDSATLRRELIGAKLMARNNGVYWRI